MFEGVGKGKNFLPKQAKSFIEDKKKVLAHDNKIVSFFFPFIEISKKKGRSGLNVNHP